MTKRNNTLWEQGEHCLTMLALAIANAPFIPRNMKGILTPLFILALILNVLFDHWKRASYSEEELERERKDERNWMIQTQAVWYCHVTEDWTLLGLFAVFGLYVQNDVVAYTMMWILLARSILTFGLRWWLNRKY